ncbi:DUF4861 family protein [Marinifilum flexuosum]|uniref:DUF4861 family protein n=1 Tax=Marinifilum flexuosum TaxID=1117708 RepID=UPI0024906AC0|nr:DUF4861 family protein [Marinifilum flexuosum]
MQKVNLLLVNLLVLICLVQCKGVSNSSNPLKNEMIAEQELSISNPLNKDQTLVPVEIKLSDLKAEMQIDSESSLLVCLADSLIPSQLDDLNGDGNKDELSFQLDIKKDSNLKVKICKVSKDIASKYVFESGVHAQMGLKNGKNPFIIKDSIFSESGDLYKETMHHGPALESEHIAYRMYFDDRSSIDVYGKMHHRLELDKTKWYSNDEFIANEYGGDILFVKNTIGIGSLRIWNGKNVETLKASKGRYAIVRASGPVRSVIDMCTMGVDGNTELLSRMMIYAGHREMIYRAYLPKEMNAEFCTGVRKIIGADVRINKEAGYISLWGTDYPRINHEKYPQVTVGLGVVVPKQWQSNLFMEDELNHLIGIQSKDSFIEYYIAASWNQERNGIQTADEMEEYMKNLSLRANASLQISY